jgi:alpha-tubulin suppressor-like RCC1 family protein
VRRGSNLFTSVPKAALAAALALAVSLAGGTAGYRATTVARPVTTSDQLGNIVAAAGGAAPDEVAVVETWGDNSAGELGNASLTRSLEPVPAITSAAGAASVTAVAAGGRHDLALLSNGTVLAWGDDTYGQLGNGSASANDDAETPALVPNLSGVVAVAAGGEHSLALLSNGTVEAWGDNDDGQLGDGTRTASDVPVPVKGLTGVSTISAGDQFSLAALSNGTVEAWGDNGFGQLGDGSLKNSDVPVVVSGLSGVGAVAAGGQHALALLHNGTAMSWGDNEDDQLGDGQDVSTQSNSTVPVAVDGLSGAVAIAAGYEHSLALLNSGVVMAWGDNGFFQLAQPQGFPSGLADSDVPLAVPGVSHATAIAAGGLFSLATLSSGKVAGWGDNGFGQLGNSSTATKQAVVDVKGLTGVTSIAAGGPDSVALVPASATGRSDSGDASALPSSPWRVVPAQDPSGNESTNLGLSAVSASSASDAWALGSSEGATEPTGEHWNGKTWEITSFAPGPDTPSSLNGVDDLSATDAWAVGTSAGRTLIEHWDGTSWTVDPSPDPETGPGAFDELEAVSGTNPDDLWAVGTFSDGENFSALLLLQWNGTAWTFFAPPTEGDQFGVAVTVVSPDDAWAVGDELEGTVSAHFNGKKWSMVTTPQVNVKDSVNDLTAIANAGADDIWASGFEDDGGINFRVPYLLRWTGKAWKLLKVPNSGSEGSLLLGVAALSATDVWVAGATFDTDGGSLALSEQFNGTSWSIVPSLDPGQLASLPSNTFEAISAVGTSTLFAIGSKEKPGRCCTFPLAERTTAG